MKSLAAAILVLAGSITIGAGIVANDIGHLRDGHSTVGYIVGGYLVIVGLDQLCVWPVKQIREELQTRLGARQRSDD